MTEEAIVAKPTLDQIFLDRAKITRSDWTPNQFIYFDGTWMQCHHGSIYSDVHVFINRHYSQHDWRIWEEPLPKPQDCPFCGNIGAPAGADREYWVRCDDANCALESPVRETERGAIKAWNRIRVVGDEE